MSTQHQCLLQSVFLPIPQMSLPLNLIQMNAENKSTLVLGQVKLQGQEGVGGVKTYSPSRSPHHARMS